jgi:hypothetical protein
MIKTVNDSLKILYSKSIAKGDSLMDKNIKYIKQIRSYVENLDILDIYKNMDDEHIINFLLESHRRQRELIIWYTNKSKNYNWLQKLILKWFKL